MRPFRNRLLSRVTLVFTCLFLFGSWESFGDSKGKGKGSNNSSNGDIPENNSGDGGQNAEQLAAMIAADAGGDKDQYQIYAVNLAKTLSQLSPEQRARVFSD